MFRRIYLDNSATTRVDERVLESMLPFFTEQYGNPSSVHQFGQQAKAAVDKARHEVAALINARPNEIVFTSGGTESNNLAIRGLAENIARMLRRLDTYRNHNQTVENIGLNGIHIIISNIEHPAVYNVSTDLESRGAKLTVIPVNSDGIVSPDDVVNAVNNLPTIVSIMAANNEIGTIQPIKEISRQIVKLRDSGHKIWLHTDAVQAVGKIPVDVEDIGCDLLSLSGHKIYAPKGIGALYIRRGVKLHPQNIGGHQERDRRGGTEAVPNIVGLGTACKIAAAELKHESERIVKLRNRLESAITELIPDVIINGDVDRRLPNISNISFGGIEGEALLINLDMHGIAVSTGSACSSGTIEPSPMIKALGRDDSLARGAIRFSLGRFNTQTDIEFALNYLPDAVRNLRKLTQASAGR